MKLNQAASLNLTERKKTANGCIQNVYMKHHLNAKLNVNNVTHTYNSFALKDDDASALPYISGPVYEYMRIAKHIFL